MPKTLINLYRQAEDYFFRALSLQCLDHEGLTAYMTGVPVQSLNVVYVRQEASLDKEVLEQINLFYEHQKLPFELIIPEDIRLPGIERMLESFGYVEIGTSVCMGIQLGDRDEASFDKIVIVKANNRNLNDWMTPLTGAFESPPRITEKYARSHEKALEKGVNFYHFSLYHHNQPISSITLSVKTRTMD